MIKKPDYSPKYYDANYEYRHVVVPPSLYKERVPADYQDFYSTEKV